METFKDEMIRCFMTAHKWQKAELQSLTLVQKLTGSKDMFQANIINRFVDLETRLIHESPIKTACIGLSHVLVF